MRQRLGVFRRFGVKPLPQPPSAMTPCTDSKHPRLWLGRAGEQDRAFLQVFGNPTNSLDPPCRIQATNSGLQPDGLTHGVTFGFKNFDYKISVELYSTELRVLIRFIHGKNTSISYKLTGTSPRGISRSGRLPRRKAHRT